MIDHVIIFHCKMKRYCFTFLLFLYLFLQNKPISKSLNRRTKQSWVASTVPSTPLCCQHPQDPGDASVHGNRRQAPGRSLICSPISPPPALVCPRSLCLPLESLQPRPSQHLHLRWSGTIAAEIFTELGASGVTELGGLGSFICFICNQLLSDGHRRFYVVFRLDTYATCVCVFDYSWCRHCDSCCFSRGDSRVRWYGVEALVAALIKKGNLTKKKNANNGF